MIIVWTPAQRIDGAQWCHCVGKTLHCNKLGLQLMLQRIRCIMIIVGCRNVWCCWGGHCAKRRKNVLPLTAMLPRNFQPIPLSKAVLRSLLYGQSHNQPKLCDFLPRNADASHSKTENENSDKLCFISGSKMVREYLQRKILRNSNSKNAVSTGHRSNLRAVFVGNEVLR